MTDKPPDLQTLIRRAIAAQIELGMDEAIVDMEAIRRSHETMRTATVAQAITSEITGQAPMENLLSAVTSSSQFTSIDDHCQAISNCQACPLGKTRTKFVYGAGNPNADLMFIGEAPGAEEDRRGEPFVGRAGQLLDKILAAIGFTRDQIFIANILKCRPPSNRDPQPEEMAHCFPYLKEQIALIQPKVMCALGRIAAQSLLNTKSTLGSMRGKFHEYENVPLLVTYHPAALLRNPNWKRGTWEDVRLLRKRYDELTG